MVEGKATVRVTTGARIHFGLFDTHAPFGGVGVMVNSPQTSVVISPSQAFDPGPIETDRLTAIAARFCRLHLSGRFTGDQPACAIRVQTGVLPHHGLGSGTQLSLAAAAALARFFQLPLSRSELVQRIADRGKRSAIGSIGFFEGGLIAEDGSADDFDRPVGDRAAAWRRIDPPFLWRYLLVQPRSEAAPVSGEVEQRAFATLTPSPASLRVDLHRLADAIFTAAQVADFDHFAASLTQFNRLSGSLFASHQGGCYNGPLVTHLVREVALAGAVAYGQSSWGPTVFVVCESEASALTIAARLGTEYHVAMTTAATAGAKIEVA